MIRGVGFLGASQRDFPAVGEREGRANKPLATLGAERFNLMTRLGCRRMAG